MPQCKAINCKNKHQKGGKSFFLIPDPKKSEANRSLCKKWIDLLRNDKLNINTFVSNSSRVVCEDHFAPDSFVDPYSNSVATSLNFKPTRKILKPGALPVYVDTYPKKENTRQSTKTLMQKRHDTQIELWPSTRSGEVGLTGQNFSSKNTVNEREVTAKDTMDEREVTVKDNMDEREVTVEDNMDEKEVIVNDSMHEIEVTVKENINEREVTVKDSMDEREVTVKDSMDEREVPVKDNMDERKVTVKDNMDEREVTVKDSMDEREVPVKDNMDERVIACNLCNQTFTNQHHLRLHKVSVHEVLKICGICGYRSYRDSIQAHIRQNHPEAYKCELSAKWFSRLYSLNRHKKAKHYPKDTKVEREITENKKTKVTKMVSSARKTSDKTGKEEQRFRCERCPKAFNSNLGLAVHRSFHTTNNQSGCAICKQMLPTSSDVLSHSCVKRNIPSGCAICKEILPTSRDVLSHSCVKSGILPKACAKCCEVLFTPFDLKFHTCTTKKHNLNKACFVCGICRVSYPTQGQLLGHMGLHTGETTLECTVCRVGFTSVDSLEKHACLGPVRKN